MFFPFSCSIPTNVRPIEPVTIQHTGKRGRPRKLVNLEYLREAMAPHRNISVTKLAALLKMDRHTLLYYIKIYGLQRKFSDLSNADLDVLVRTYKQKKPDSGLRYLVGFLRSHGLRIQRRRVIKSLRRVDGLGSVLRRRATIQRKKYTSPRPNALWHCDGHHKLIQYGVVIHGFIDGFCRTVHFSVSVHGIISNSISIFVQQVTGIRASTNNRPATVLGVFLEAIEVYGTPSRLRGDRGGENVDLSVWMILRRGPNRASFMWGSYVCRISSS